MIPYTETYLGDITKLDVDVIVNAAGPSLLGGAGVDNAIHSAAGPGLYKECLALGGCDFGQAKLTKAYNLPSKYIVHTVGPILGVHTPEEAEKLLRSCYVESLKIADELGVESIAFPAISTGAFGLPKEEAALIARSGIIQFYSERILDCRIKKIIMVAFTKEDKEIYYPIFLDPFNTRRFFWTDDDDIEVVEYE